MDELFIHFFVVILKSTELCIYSFTPDKSNWLDDYIFSQEYSQQAIDTSANYPRIWRDRTESKIPFKMVFFQVFVPRNDYKFNL